MSVTYIDGDVYQTLKVENQEGVVLIYGEEELGRKLIPLIRQIKMVVN